MKILPACLLPLACVVVLAAVGCRSPYYADQGALLGGLTGAGVGAIVGDSLGDAGAGAVLGAGVGAITGSAIGGGLDEIEARNRAQIAAQLGRPVAAGAASIDDVIAMSTAGVEDSLIINHLRAHGAAQVPTSDDLIRLQQAGVSASVVSVLQNPPPPQVVHRTAGPRPVIIEEHYYEPPYYHPHHYHYWRGRHHHHRPHASWGISFSSDH